MLTGDSICEGPRKVNLLHLVPCIVDSAFTVSERLIALFTYLLLYSSHTVFREPTINIYIYIYIYI